MDHVRSFGIIILAFAASIVVSLAVGSVWNVSSPDEDAEARPTRTLEAACTCDAASGCMCDQLP